MILLKSFFSLGLLQALSYAAPLIVLWAIGQSYTDAELGQFLIIQSVAAFGSIFIEFGFHIPAVRSASEAKSIGRLGDYLWDIHLAKLMLTVAVIPCLLIFIIFKIPGGSNPIFLISTIFISCTTAFRPLWFFQTINSFKILIYLEIVGVLIGLIFASFSAYFRLNISLVLLAWCLPKSLLLIISVVYCHTTFPARFGTIKRALLELQKSGKFFISKFSTSAMHLTAPMILLLVVGPSAALVFQKAERVFTAFQTFLNVVSQVTYPIIVDYARLGSQDSRKISPAIINAIQILMSLSVSLFILIFAPHLIQILWSERNDDATSVLRILAIAIPFININTVIGLNYLMPKGRDFSVIVPSLGGAIGAVSALFLLPNVFGASIGAWSILIGEFVVFVIIAFAAMRVSRQCQSRLGVE
nr:oligosaccharide flippase family protein [uncultured Sphingorhabdus sp.]